MSTNAMLKEVDIEGIRNGDKKHAGDVVAIEIPLTVVLNDTEIATLLCSPGYSEELALGYLLSEGIIARESEIDGVLQNPRSRIIRVLVPDRFVSLDGFRGGRLIGSGCANALPVYREADALGLTPIRSDYSVPARRLSERMRAFQKTGSVFRESGGTHACAIQSEDGFSCFAEDIGRHNALDKTVGRCFLDGAETDRSLLLTTGRISSEIVFKVVKLGVPIVVSRSAPTSLALEVAEKLDLTVVGFARGSRMNCYTHGRRVT